MDQGPTRCGEYAPEHGTAAMKHDDSTSGLCEPGMVGEVAISQ